MPDAIAASTRVASSSSNSSKKRFCRAIGKREHAVQKRGDRRQLFEHRSFARLDTKAGRVFESLKARKLHLSPIDARIELKKRRARIRAFEIVLRPEQALASGLALAARDGAEAVEAFGDGREEAFLAFHVGGDGPEQRRLRLIGAVRTAKALNGGVGFPAGLQQIMDALSLVPRRKIGVIGAPRAAGIREHQDTFLVVHETLRFGEVRGAGSRLGHETSAAIRSGLLHNAAIASGDFRDLVRSEVVQDLIERGLHRRQRGELLDQTVADFDRFSRLHGLAVEHHGTRLQVAFLVRIALVKLGRETFGKIIEHIFARRDVNGKIAPFGGGDFSKAALHQAFAGRDELHHGGGAFVEIGFD